ncbi:MAG: hypothetical protein CM1200mP28_13270 [Deltaproteobacteria bacterium]|nr:MAG: hypothetical protein CM1200mP28_13270 [Deltaproteobacteria bacterium]
MAPKVFNIWCRNQETSSGCLCPITTALASKDCKGRTPLFLIFAKYESFSLDSKSFLRIYFPLITPTSAAFGSTPLYLLISFVLIS